MDNRIIGRGDNSYIQAVTFLKNHSSTAKQYIDGLEKSKIVYTINIMNSINGKPNPFIDTTRNQYNASWWAPDMGAYVKTQNCSRTYYNPAMILLHEMGHLTNYIVSPEKDASYGNTEERRVETGIEAQVRNEIYEDGDIRQDHGVVFTLPVTSVINPPSTIKELYYDITW